MKEVVLGIDIGGSHITAALVNVNQNEELPDSRKRSRVRSNGTIEQILEDWSKTILDTLSTYTGKVDHAYIAMPGPLNYRKGICLIQNQRKYGALYGQNLKQLLSPAIGIKPSNIFFMNDAACFLKGETSSGSVADDGVIALTIGTGLGTAFSKNGMMQDANFWKIPFKDGIAEDYISTRWFIKRYLELSGKVIKDVKDLVENHSSEPEFKVIFEEFSLNLASFMYLFIRKKMPVSAVIGGNISHASDYFLSDTRKHLAGMMGYSLQVKRSELGEKAIMLGAVPSSIKP